MLIVNSSPSTKTLTSSVLRAVTLLTGIFPAFKPQIYTATNESVTISARMHLPVEPFPAYTDLKLSAALAAPAALAADVVMEMEIARRLSRLAHEIWSPRFSKITPWFCHAMLPWY
ncbi:hypothetical protein N7541_006789 [Penicillium brevicompactum]|uniref:Uncharacterized protein n=1 Tax=Penicillium brevicompactum TaxID=5074 RepID=A0A9W9R776_PENBR|nr:hypothetical protein N7541_006789 [Penicillium brevicompactum]